MMWVDKYRPRNLTCFAPVNDDLAMSLKRISSTDDFPHILLYGPAGSGKRTLVHAMVREVFGPESDKVRVENRPWQIELPSRKLEIELTTVTSNYHVELSPADVSGSQDRYVVQEVIKDMARSKPLDVCGRHRFKVLVLYDVDLLSKDAQHALRRTMEKYSSVCRLFMTASNVSRIIDPVRSRCVCMRVPSPSSQQIRKVIEHVARAESIFLPASFANKVVASCDRNLRRALLSMEVAHSVQYPFTEDQEVPPPDWETFAIEIANDVIGEQSPSRLQLVRGKLYELLANCIPPEKIMRTLLNQFLKQMKDDKSKARAAEIAALYAIRLAEGSKAVFHLEAFVANIMAELKKK